MSKKKTKTTTSEVADTEHVQVSDNVSTNFSSNPSRNLDLMVDSMDEIATLAPGVEPFSTTEKGRSLRVYEDTALTNQDIEIIKLREEVAALREVMVDLKVLADRLIRRGR